jgi:hypothetical protein
MLTFAKPEEVWKRSKNPYKLARMVHLRGVKADRKFRLVAVAFCRRFWAKLNKGQRRLVEAVERHVGGEAGDDEVQRAARAIRGSADRSWPVAIASGEAWPCLASAIGKLLGLGGSTEPGELAGELRGPYGRYLTDAAEWRRECDWCCDIVRDILADAFHPVPIVPSWKTPAVLGLAEGAYEDRALPDGTLDGVRLAILADAIEEAGCREPHVLEHLRGPGPHVRGCWVIDSILGKAI